MTPRRMFWSAWSMRMTRPSTHIGHGLTRASASRRAPVGPAPVPRPRVTHLVATPGNRRGSLAHRCEAPGAGSVASATVLVRVLIGLAVLVVVGAVAVVLERRRRAGVAPVRDPFPVPRQLTRADFPRPEAPWLVALFSSTTCDGCEAMRGRIVALDSADVAVVDVSWQEGRALHERYEISGVPMVLVADGEGVVRRAFVGSVTATDLWAGVAGARDPSLGITHGLDALA